MTTVLRLTPKRNALRAAKKVTMLDSTTPTTAPKKRGRKPSQYTLEKRLEEAVEQCRILQNTVDVRDKLYAALSKSADAYRQDKAELTKERDDLKERLEAAEKEAFWLRQEVNRMSEIIGRTINERDEARRQTTLLREVHVDVLKAIRG